MGTKHDMVDGWKYLTGDVNWEDYGATWCKRVFGTRIFFLVRFENMHDAIGENDCRRDHVSKYHADVFRVDLDDITNSKLTDALRCVGLKFNHDGNIENEDRDGVLSAKKGTEEFDLMLVDACLSYGVYAPLWNQASENYPERLRAKARRQAEHLMRDESACQRALNRPVNAIGTTAESFGKGIL